MKAFWRQHGEAIRSGRDFAARHAVLLATARAELSLKPVSDPVGLIERAREESGANRWPALLPPSDVIAYRYFPEYRIQFGGRVREEPPRPLPLTALMSEEERERFLQTFDEVLKEHWGVDRFEAYRKRFTPPDWLARIPRQPERDEKGYLPRLADS